MSCEHDCEKPAAFPKTIENRPGLPQIDYRIGAYAELRARMLHLLDQDPALSGWTHRGPDDPGIALLEGTAVVGDILTFYQQLYANERYLRTAQWRESIAELVRLLGYRLAPGVGGEATFALAVKGEEPVIVPKGFGLKADIEGGSKPAEFESTREITAYPHLSAFSLYRPRETPLSTDGTQIFKVQAAGIPAGLEFAEGDRVLLGEPEPSMSDPTQIENAQILTVESSWQAFDTLHVKFTTPLKWSDSIYTLKAYKLGESYRHFGHNAPIKTVTPSDSSYSTDDTNYIRSVNGNTAIPDPDLAADAMPLDAEVKNLVAGAYVIVQARLQTSSTSSSSTTRYTLVRKIDAVESASYTWGMVSGASTVLTLDGNLATDGKNYADIRSFTFHEVIGEPFRLRAQEQPTSETSGAGLDFYGTDAQAQLLRGRDLLLMGPDDQVRGVAVTDVQTSSSSSDAERNLFRRLTLDQSVDYADFPIDTPIVTVYGNLVPATQGKTQKEVVLGSGDRRKTFQTFPLSDAPLTYLLDETRTPAQTPELTVYVDGIAWTQVDSFFNYGPGDAVYIVREDDAGKSYVQFGDNKTGRALPSGLNNVTAIFRVGNAANGALKDGTTPSISGKLKNFDKLHLPDAVTVGSPREDGDNARTAAPGKMQSLGRMVSLADIEAEALALPHVLKVRAAWSAPEGFPLVSLTVLTQSGTSADLAAVRDSMRTYNRCRGPARYPIDVVQGVRQYVYLHIEAGFEATRREADVVSAIKGALGLAGEEGDGIDGEDGLFGLKRRQFGQNAHKSQIIAAVQNAPGVTWVNLKAAQNLPLGSPPETDPLALAPPATEVVHAALACPTSRILVLHTAHLVLSLAKDEIARECSA